jgi:hypothetical protein
MLEEWLRIYGYDIEAGESVQPIERIRERLPERCSAMHRIFTDRLYDAWLARVRTYSQRSQASALASKSAAAR